MPSEGWQPVTQSCSRDFLVRSTGCQASDFLRQSLNLIRLLRGEACNIHAYDPIRFRALDAEEAALRSTDP